MRIAISKSPKPLHIYLPDFDDAVEERNWEVLNERSHLVDQWTRWHKEVEARESASLEQYAQGLVRASQQVQEGGAA